MPRFRFPDATTFTVTLVLVVFFFLVIVFLVRSAAAQSTEDLDWQSVDDLATHVEALRALDTFATDHDHDALLRLTLARAVVVDSLDDDVAEVNRLLADLEAVTLDQSDTIEAQSVQIVVLQDKLGSVAAEVASWKNRLARLLAPFLN